MAPKQSSVFREYAENSAPTAENANDDPSFQWFRRMEAAWLALAEEQDWLEGEKSPIVSQQKMGSRN
jgi:hypothetical protein